MDIKKVDDTHVSVTVTEKQWAQLAQIIEWVITEGGSMDDVTSDLPPEEISPVLDEWQKITMAAISQ